MARIPFAIAILIGTWTVASILALTTLSTLMLRRFDGPYNGGADKMTLLILIFISLAQIAPSQFWADMAMSYLAIQVVLSYFVSGWVKLKNPDWRNGQALSDVFRFSTYPVAENLRGLSNVPRLVVPASLAVIALEVAFPLALVSHTTLIVALTATGLFHLANACVFGLNRFFWAWIAAYPSLIWFQARIVPPMF